MLFKVEGINIYSGEVDWSVTLEASDKDTACLAGRVVCVATIGAEKAGKLDMTAFETKEPNLDYKPK